MTKTEKKLTYSEQIIELIQDAKRQILIKKDPAAAIEALNVATDILANINEMDRLFE